MNEKELEEIRRKKKETAKDLFNPDNLADFEEEGGILNGSLEDTEKSDGEAFPDELEEQTPEERRKKFQVHQNNKKSEN